jgi:hypothetical protein
MDHSRLLQYNALHVILLEHICFMDKIITNSWITALHKRPAITQLIKRFPAFYGNQCFTDTHAQKLRQVNPIDILTAHLLNCLELDGNFLSHQVHYYKALHSAHMVCLLVPCNSHHKSDCFSIHPYTTALCEVHTEYLYKCTLILVFKQLISICA